MWVCFGQAIRENFHRAEWEDPHFFQFTAAHIHSVADAFAYGSYFRGLYRPLSTNLYYWLGRLAWHNDLGVYHSLNVALYVANALLVYRVCRRFLSPGLSLLVSLLFSTRSAHVEVLLYTSQIQTLLPMFFSLLALDAYLAASDSRRGRALLLGAAAALATLLALLSKESSVTLPFVLVVFWLARRERGLADLRRQLTGAAAALASVGVWYLIARPHLAIAHNRHWHYVFNPLELAGNYMAYLTAFGNVLVNPVHRVAPAVKLEAYPAILAVRASAESRWAFLALTVVCVVTLLMRQTNSRHRPSARAALAAASFLGFVLMLAPYVVLKDRLLMYYGYFGYFPLALSAVCGVEVAAVAIARRVLPLPRWQHLPVASPVRDAIPQKAPVRTTRNAP